MQIMRKNGTFSTPYVKIYSNFGICYEQKGEILKVDSLVPEIQLIYQKFEIMHILGVYLASIYRPQFVTALSS